MGLTNQTSVAENRSNSSIRARLHFFRTFSWFVACSTALIGSAALSSRVFGIGFLESLVPASMSMTVNTAGILVVAGVALWASLPGALRQLRLILKQLLALLVVMVGLLTLSEHAFGLNLEVGQLFFSDAAKIEGGNPLERMSPATAVCVVATGMSILYMGLRPALSQAFSLVVMLTTMVALVEHVFDMGTLRGAVGVYTFMAIHTAILFMLLSLGVVAAQPSKTFVQVLVSDTAGGTVARNMLAWIPIVIFSISALLLVGEAQGFYDNRFTLGLLATLSIVTLTYAIVRISTRLHRVDQSRHRAKMQLQKLNSRLEQLVADRTRELEKVNASLVTEIADRKRAEDDIRRLSLTDELTGLHNRRSFFLLAEQGIKAARRNNLVSLLFFVDLDGLKRINDTYGHEAGDLMILAAAEVLQMGFRGTDVVARIGGDEFVVLAVGTSELPDVISARVQALVDQFNTGRCRYSLSLSIGVTSCRPQELKSVDEMLADADALMYANKERRRHELLNPSMR